MNIHYLLYTTIFVIFSLKSQVKYPQNFFRSPVDIKIAVAGTFGELRHNHFHSGIDIKTKQKKNIPIYAAQDGYLARIKVSTHGFGKALYIDHPKGFTTVYAHLESFEPLIEERAKKEHYKIEQYEIDFLTKKDSIALKKGDLIGFSGNTGSSTAPHLHFEIRDTQTQEVINPMLFNLPILDTTYPIIKSILIYYANGEKDLIDVIQINKNTYKINQKIEVNQPFQVSVQTYDLLDAAPNKNGVYSFALYLNNQLFFKNEMERFSFNETRYINAHIDYSYQKNNGEKFQKCFLEPYNNLSTNKTYITQKIGENLQSGTHQLGLIVKDSYNNSSYLNFDFELIKKTDISPQLNSNNIIRAKQVFELDTSDCKIYIPNYSLYKDYLFTYTKTIDSTMQYPIYKILDDSIPSHKKYVLSIKIDTLEKDLRKKTIMVKYNNGEFKYVQSQWAKDKIIGKPNTFGEFTIAIDTVKPVIEDISIKDHMISCKIYDELSGIESYRGEIDNKWVLMEYDFKTNIIKYQFDTTSDKRNCTLVLKVSDKVGNSNQISVNYSQR